MVNTNKYLSAGFLSVIGIGISILMISCDEAHNEINYTWSENIGSNPDLPFLPDATANYFGFAFERETQDKMGLVIEGQFPDARYMSFNVYDNARGTPINAIVDFELQPDPGSVNPFADLQPASARNYTLLICPDLPHQLNYANQLRFDTRYERIGLLLRYYVPQSNDYANVPLPSIRFVDLETGKDAVCRRTSRIALSDFADRLSIFAQIVDQTQAWQDTADIEFYRSNGVGLYANIDNQYLFSNVTLPPDNLVMLKFKPPSFASSPRAFPAADVRYYSLIIGDRQTYTYKTFYDEQFHIASDGFAYIVIGRPDAEILARSQGLNFVEWPAALGNSGLVIYRNLLTRPGFEFALTKVPDVLENLVQVMRDHASFQAPRYIGEYAPSGKIMTRADFLEDFDGFEVDY